MKFKNWTPEILIKAYELETDLDVKDALFRLGSHEGMENVWLKLPIRDDVVVSLKVAAIFYWQSQNLEKPSTHSKDIKRIKKIINEIQSLMLHTFSANNEKLYADLESYKLGLNSDSYKHFYNQPRQQLIWCLYRLTHRLFKSPNHDLVAYLASAISNQTLAKSDVQPSYKKLSRNFN